MLKNLFGPAKNDPFNQALSQFRKLRDISDTEEFKATILEVIRLCQIAIQKRKSDGDAHVLLANGYYVAALHMLGEAYIYCLPRAAAVIYEWKTKHLPTKNYANGEKVYQGILEALESPMPDWTGMVFKGDMSDMHKRHYYDAISPNAAVELKRALTAPRPEQTKETTDGKVNKHILLSTLYRGEGRLEEAKRELQAGLRLYPNNAEMHTLLGAIYAEQGRSNEAIQELRIGLRLNPDDTNAHLLLGSLYGMQDRWDEVISELQTVLRINPDEATAHLPLGTAYLRQGQLDKAIQELRVGLTIDPNNIEAHFLLGRGYERQGHLEEAIREYQIVLQINPDDARTHFTLGELFADQGQFPEAIQEFQAGLYIDSDNGDAHFCLGMLYEQQGHRDKAIQELQVAVRLGSERAREALK